MPAPLTLPPKVTRPAIDLTGRSPEAHEVYALAAELGLDVVKKLGSGRNQKAYVVAPARVVPSAS